MEIEKIDYNGEWFPSVKVTIFKGTENELGVNVSSTDLNDIIMKSIADDQYYGELKHIDENIAFFMDRFDLLGSTEEEIIKEVESAYNKW